ncbi:MAG: LarC family nickel insertion protein, partial [Clostridiales Family XIII bacterium]|nr:LarC family nickel insertion protein [Clostridiales Family XIII bacterium]
MTSRGSGKIIFLNASSGISGDMFLGAMADLIKKLEPGFDMEREIGKISIPGSEWKLTAEPGMRAGITGTKADVRVERVHEREHGHSHDHDHESHDHRRLSHIREILSGSSDLPPAVRSRAGEAFSLLAETEARIHGTTPEEICFHEVGAVDSIVDIVGAMLMMEKLGWPRVMSSPVNVGSGTVRCAHGVLPVPAPAAASLLEGLRVFSAGEPMERTTPTGALLLNLLVGKDGFGGMPSGRIVCSGIGLGGRDTPELPNILTATLIEGDGVSGFRAERPSLLEANIDDMNPQDFALAMERLLEAGALDAWCENILMKKGRPALKLCCLAREGDEERVSEIIMRETTTIGV